MTRPQSSLLRLAIAIQNQLLKRGARRRLEWPPVARWQGCEGLARQIGRAEQLGWQLAADDLRRDLRHNLLSLQSDLALMAEELGTVACSSFAITLNDLYQDLVALEEEFGQVSHDRRTKTLAVTTEPIVLDGHYLGPFEIRLDWGRLTSDSCYRVVACEPHPAGSRSDVTHPHVADEHLCEGDGRHAIRQALVQGRLLDFFTLVRGVLRTYNAESPFVALDNWHGQSCSDCGYLTDEEELSGCGRCGASLCDECHDNCTDCGDVYCSGCLATCQGCDGAYCPSCLRRCAECRAPMCSGCLTEERCVKCNEQLDESLDDDQIQPGPAVHTDSLGQATLPA